MKLLAVVCLGSCLQMVVGYVIVNRDQAYYDQPPATPEMGLMNAYGKQLLQLYYLVQVMRSYHRPAYQEPTAILSNLIDRLTKEELRDELERLLVGVDGFEEVFNIGEYAERDPIKEQLANDFRLLFPIVAKTLSGLHVGGVDSSGEVEDTLQSKLRDAFNDIRGLLVSVVQSESEVFHEIEELHDTFAEGRTFVDVRTEKIPNLVETVHVTEMPVAVDKPVVNDYDLEEEQTSPTAKENIVEDADLIDIRMQDEDTLEFLPDGSDVKYDLGPDVSSQEPLSEEDDEEAELIILTEDAKLKKDSFLGGEGNGPTAVLVKDPEIAALIPHIIEQMRLENITPEEEETLAEIFDELWPLMVTEADRLRSRS